jgi:predicted metal-dependent hydrolase
VWAESGIIHVSGRAEHLSRRLHDWLRKRAREEILLRAGPMAERIGRDVTVLRLGDPRSRWGSCTSRGALAFSWRLILSPDEVLTYVVAHEVAHLAEMNHSPAFWRLVGDLTSHAGLAKAWLKHHGTELYRYG